MRIAELWRYPVKSMRGEQLSTPSSPTTVSPATASPTSTGLGVFSPRGPGTGCSGWPAPWAPTVSR